MVLRALYYASEIKAEVHVNYVGGSNSELRSAYFCDGEGDLLSGGVRRIRVLRTGSARFNRKAEVGRVDLLEDWSRRMLGQRVVTDAFGGVGVQCIVSCLWGGVLGRASEALYYAAVIVAVLILRFLMCRAGIRRIDGLTRRIIF